MTPLLLIDGDHNFRQALAIALRLDGHQVTAAESVELARRELERGEYGWCIVDLRLEGAAELVSALVAGARAGVVATSIDPDLLADTLGRHPEIAALEKPFRVDDLRALLGPTSAVA
ncbi:MAG TPA: hypothetical protein VFE30_05725 [Anaeromyxobacteraceae bacterium]|jgi:DNA-binding NtrC family response regulator|nr:hypothetical protein [Anaeromyxobacteraceae bacterium]